MSQYHSYSAMGGMNTFRSPENKEQGYLGPTIVYKRKGVLQTYCSLTG